MQHAWRAVSARRRAPGTQNYARLAARQQPGRLRSNGAAMPAHIDIADIGARWRPRADRGNASETAPARGDAWRARFTRARPASPIAVAAAAAAVFALEAATAFALTTTLRALF